MPTHQPPFTLPPPIAPPAWHPITRQPPVAPHRAETNWGPKLEVVEGAATRQPPLPLPPPPSRTLRPQSVLFGIWDGNVSAQRSGLRGCWDGCMWGLASLCMGACQPLHTIHPLPLPPPCLCAGPLLPWVPPWACSWADGGREGWAPSLLGAEGGGKRGWSRACLEHAMPLEAAFVGLRWPVLHSPPYLPARRPARPPPPFPGRADQKVSNIWMQRATDVPQCRTFAVSGWSGCRTAACSHAHSMPHPRACRTKSAQFEAWFVGGRTKRVRARSADPAKAGTSGAP
jgi:hypothetical protein